jgi:hypothetical protein
MPVAVTVAPTPAEAEPIASPAAESDFVLATIGSATAEPVDVPAAEPETVRPVAQEPAFAEPETVVPAAALAQPVPANDVVAEPLVKPIIIGAGGEPPLEKKRGWWRR